MLIEFALDRFKSLWVLKNSLTKLWQSSKFPSIAKTSAFFPLNEHICASCTGDTPPFGYKTTIDTPSTFWKPFNAAPPVSPLVAVKIVIFLS